MIKVFIEENLIRIKKTYKNSIIAICICLFIAIASCTTLCFFINDNTVVAINIISCALFIIIGFVALTFLFVGVMPNKKKISIYNEVLSSFTTKIRGTINNVSSQLTVLDNLMCYEIEINLPETTKILRYIGENPCFVLGEAYYFEIYKDWIVAYEK